MSLLSESILFIAKIPKIVKINKNINGAELSISNNPYIIGGINVPAILNDAWAIATPVALHLVS